MTTAAITKIQDVKSHTLVGTMAGRYGLQPEKFLSTLAGTIFPAGKNPTGEQIAAFLVVANHYNLNPFVKEIYAFPAQGGGGIVPIVSIDGWLTIINRQPQLDGIEFEDRVGDDGKLIAVTAKIYRKDRSHSTEVTEYMSECARATDPWKKWPARMLRHKALIQAARYAFGLAGIYDPDEAERIAESGGQVEYNAEALKEKTIANTQQLKSKLTIVAEPTEVEPEVIEAEPVLDEPADYVDEPVHELPDDDQESSKDADLIIAIGDMFSEKLNGDADEIKKFLKGRDLSQMSTFALAKLHDDLMAF